MPAPAYTESEAALHELGHTLVACALGLPFQHVEIRPAEAPRIGWAGQCLLVDEPPPRRVAMNAFSLGGPILQILTDPISLAGHATLFQPSLFSNPARCMDHNDGFPIASMHLGWADLFITCMMHQMHGWPPFMMNTGFKGTKPWMPQLEDCIRTFLSLPQVQEVVMDLQPKLVRAVRLDDEVAIAAFNLKVSAADCAALVAFVAAQPD